MDTIELRERITQMNLSGLPPVVIDDGYDGMYGILYLWDMCRYFGMFII